MARTSSSASGDQPLPTDNLLAIADEFQQSGQTVQARDIYRQILSREPGHAVALHHLGILAHQAGDHQTAADLLHRAIVNKPDYVEALSNLCGILRALKRVKEAMAAGQKAIALNPDYAQAYSNLGNLHEDLGNYEEACALYEKAMAVNPNLIEAKLNAGNMLRKLGRHTEATAIYKDLVTKRPDVPEPYFYFGNLLRELAKPDEAIVAYRHALALRPTFADAYCNLGNVFMQQSKYDEAEEAYRQAIALKPTLAQAQSNLGTVMETRGRVAEAIEYYRTALSIDPSLIGARCELHLQRRLACDWDGIEAEEQEFLERLKTQTEPVPPFSVLSLDVTPAQQLRVSEVWAKSYEKYRRLRFDHAHRRKPHAAGRRLKIGYLSADFQRHATALLMAELFERHDRERFEIIAYSHGADDHSDMRWRLKDAFDRFVDIRDVNATDAAQMIYNDGIDILIDLKGYTQHARTEIAALRPAPVQVNFIGYPGSMGADFIDYVIADPFVLPFDQQPFYAEKIVHLPHSYQPNDTRRRIADETPSRASCGLPDEGVVFCCFNNSYKITQTIFSIWMRLLKEVPGSVLWLFDGNPLVKDNLRKQAAKRGIAPERLVFAPKLLSPEHLARHRLADLFLDTLPYNAHTTTSDALWAGLPVITCAGTTFAGRVAGSLLNAVGMPELVTGSLEAYEALALDLAQNPDKLFALRQKLLKNRYTAPLFDIAGFTRDLEKTYTHMWDLWVAGEEPQAFAITSGSETEAAKPVSARIAFAACPLCGSTAHKDLLGADCSKHPLYRPSLPETMTWFECSDCQHVYTDGYFDEAAKTLLLRHQPQSQNVGQDMESLRLPAGKILSRIVQHHAPEGDWLDVGFGNGSLLFTAEEWGFRPVGLDLRPENISLFSQLGYEAYRGTIEDYATHLAQETPAQRFSVISFADVLQQMPFPVEALKAAHGLLADKGVLFLSMPNHDTMLWRLLHANMINPYWGEIEHYHSFSRKRLFALLDACGFTPVDYQVSESIRIGMEVIAIRR